MTRKCQACLLLTFAAMISGCAESANKDLNRINSELGRMRGVQAEQRADIDAIRSEMQSLSGRVEELEYGQNQRLGKDLNTLREDLTSLKGRVPPPNGVPAELLATDEDIARDSSSVGGAGQLSEGLSFIRQGDFRSAIGALDDGLSSNGLEPELGPHFLFWQGVAYDGLNDNRNALKAYNQIVTEFPKHPRVPAALLREASVFVRLGDEKAAVATLKKLTKDYPRTTEAQTGADRLRALQS